MGRHRRERLSRPPRSTAPAPLRPIREGRSSRWGTRVTAGQTIHRRRSAIRAGGPTLGHDGVGDRRRGASSPRIRSARWRRRCVLAGPAVARSVSILPSNLGPWKSGGLVYRSRGDHSISAGGSLAGLSVSGGPIGLR